LLSQLPLWLLGLPDRIEQWSWIGSHHDCNDRNNDHENAPAADEAGGWHSSAILDVFTSFTTFPTHIPYPQCL
jgi:hypothetical protein